jgi:Zn-finger nucleic acid-binding protein
MLILSATVTGRQFSIILAVFLVVSNREGEAVYSADDPNESQARRKVTVYRIQKLFERRRRTAVDNYIQARVQFFDRGKGENLVHKTSQGKTSQYRTPQMQNVPNTKYHTPQNIQSLKMSQIQNVSKTKHPSYKTSLLQNVPNTMSQTSKHPNYETSQASKHPKLHD